MKAFVDSQVKPSSRNISAALAQLTRQVAARGGWLDPRLVAEYAPRERKIAADLATRWREGPGR